MFIYLYIMYVYVYIYSCINSSHILGFPSMEYVETYGNIWEYMEPYEMNINNGNIWGFQEWGIPKGWMV